jgi:hypothetical protein
MRKKSWYNICNFTVPFSLVPTVANGTIKVLSLGSYALLVRSNLSLMPAQLMAGTNVKPLFGVKRLLSLL